MIAVDYGMLRVEGSTPDHAEYLAEHLRKADLREIRESFPDIGALKVLEIGMNVSKPFPRTILDQDEPIAMFGLAPVIRNGKKTGVVWLLGSDRIKANRMRFLRLTKYWVERLMEEVHAEQLFTQADLRNKEHIRWLEWAGFKKEGDPFPVGPKKMPFQNFLLTSVKPRLIKATVF